MARIIRSQAEDAARIQAEKQKAKEQEEKARLKLNELEEEHRKIQEGLQQLSKSREEAEQDLKKVYEEEKKVLEEKEKKQLQLKRISEEEKKAQTELIRIRDERTKLQNEIRSAKGVAIPHIPRRIRSVNQSNTEIEITPISRYNTSLIIPDNSLFTKANVGDYVSYVGEGDGNTITWRVWKKTDSSVVITPVLNWSCRQLKLFGITDYLDIVKNVSTQTDKINRACKEWYINSSLGITAENIRSMTVEDINEACGYTPPKIKHRYAFYPNGTSVSGTIRYNGNTYRRTSHDSCIATFYTYDGGGVEKTDLNGYAYREPEWFNPVYVSGTYYYFDPSRYNHVNNSSVKVGSILGSGYGWLASTSVDTDLAYARLGVRNAYSDGAGASRLENSGGYTDNCAYGVRPLVTLSSTLQATGGDGSSGAPWRIRK